MRLASRGFLQAQLDAVRGPDNKGAKVRLLTDGAAIPGTVKGADDDLFVWIKDDLIAASPNPEAIARLSTLLKAPEVESIQVDSVSCAAQ